MSNVRVGFSSCRRRGLAYLHRSTLQPYLEGTLSKLAQLLQRNVKRVQEQAVTAIASIADVATDDFRPYYAAFMPGLKAILAVQGKEYRMLRGKSMECISLIGDCLIG